MFFAKINRIVAGCVLRVTSLEDRRQNSGDRIQEKSAKVRKWEERRQRQKKWEKRGTDLYQTPTPMDSQ
ncbi:MAG: hypothetical protein A2Y07_10305 [Planctomycetes bacterium GWF2_50_10]|nr:MAG: hypothetical protein A2Y07_10305 [Planctomycetes bacterium GWF2_50_10]